MKATSILIACLALMICLSTGCNTLQFGAEQHGTLRIRAFIDGSDTVKIKGNELWYEHHKYDLPGKWQNRFDEPTYINEKPWKPEWHGSVCDSYKDFRPALPKVKAEQIKLTKIEARGEVTITEPPSEENGYTLSILLDDKRLGGAEWYEILVEW